MNQVEYDVLFGYADALKREAMIKRDAERFERAITQSIERSRASVKRELKRRAEKA